MKVKLEVYVKYTEVKETEPLTVSAACSPGGTNTVRGPCETVCEDGKKKESNSVKSYRCSSQQKKYTVKTMFG